MKQFSLVGVNGNAFSVIGYTGSAMKKAGFSKQQISEYTEQATSSDYNHLISLSVEWLDKCNEALGLEDDEDDWSEWY